MSTEVKKSFGLGPQHCRIALLPSNGVVDMKPRDVSFLHPTVSQPCGMKDNDACVFNDALWSRNNSTKFTPGGSTRVGSI